MLYNSVEDINSPEKVQARQEAKEEERKKLEQDFKNNVDISIIDNFDESKLPNKDKENIISRLTTEYGKDKEGFDLISKLENILLDDTLSLSVGPQSPEKGESFQDFKKRIIEFKNELYGNIIEGNNVIENTNNKTQKKEIKNVKDKIGSRLNLEEKQINKKLNNSSEKEKNIEQASKIFFKKEQITEYSNNPKSESSNVNNLKELGDNIIEKDKIVDEDLEHILGNFVINIGKEKIEYYASENPEEVNEALNNAFELQIEKVKDGKVNYRTETVDNLKKEIIDSELTNPLEKLEKFKKLKEEVNLSVGSIAKKREKATTGVERKKLEAQKKELQKEYKKLNKKPEQNKKRILEIIKKAKEIDKKLNEKPKSGEVMGGSRFDKNSSGVEKISENY